MLSGSAMLRVAVLFVTAGLLAALVQYFWPQMAQEPAMQSAGQPVTGELQPVAPSVARDPVRTIPTVKAPAAPAARPPAPPPAPPAMPEPVQGTAPSTSPNELADSAPPVPPAATMPPAEPMPSGVPSSPEATHAAERAQGDAGPRAVALVDLNTATLAQLNGLKGGGNIGRAIIQRRPYSSVDQLLSKRVLSRATYEKIKDQVTVQ